MNKCIFINISSDNVIITDGKNTNILLSRNNLESILGRTLVQLQKEIGFENVLVLNGPGSFTNLRVGTLCLNILNTVVKDKINIYSISKIDLYKIFFDTGCLPRYGVIYIGQKRNIRIRDFEENKKIGQFGLNEIENLDIYNSQDFFLDSVEDENYFSENLRKLKTIKITYNGKDLIINNNSIETSNLGLSAQKSVSANYMMEPSITISTK